MTATMTPPPASAVTREASTHRRAWAVVAKREMTVQLTDKSFILSTFVTIAIVVGIFGLNYFMATRTQSFDVAVVTSQGQRVVEDAQSRDAPSGDSTTLTVSTVADRAAGEAQVSEGAVDALLIREGTQWVVVVDNEIEPALQGALESAVTREQTASLAAAAGQSLDDVYTAMTVRYSPLSGSQNDSWAFNYFAGLVFGFLLYFANMLFGLSTATSVVHEKQSRVVEIIAAAIPIRDLLVGKVLASLTLAVIQLGLYLSVGLIGLRFSDASSYLPAVAGAAGWFIAFFVFGFVALSCLWAMLGAMASRTEDVQYSTQPMQIGLMVCFFGGIFLTGNWLVIGSYLPIISAIAMPRRMLTDSAQWWEALIALGITAVFAVIALRFGAAVFHRTLLQTGGRITLRQALSGSR